MLRVGLHEGISGLLGEGRHSEVTSVSCEDTGESAAFSREQKREPSWHLGSGILYLGLLAADSEKYMPVLSSPCSMLPWMAAPAD